MTDQIKEIVYQISSILVPGIGAEQIYLFGSHAQGIPNSNSDIDVFVVADLSKRRKIDITQQARRLLLNKVFMPVDILVCDRNDFNNRKGNQTTFEYLIATEGIKFYG
jgi:predicted nucleotidyltransferase